MRGPGAPSAADKIARELRTERGPPRSSGDTSGGSTGTGTERDHHQRKARWKRTGHRQCGGGPEDAGLKDNRDDRGRVQGPGCYAEHPGAARYHPTKPLPSRAKVVVWCVGVMPDRKSTLRASGDARGA